MSKTAAVIVAAVLGLCAIAQAGSNAARVDINAFGEKISLTPGKAEGGNIAMQTWLKDEEMRKQGITTGFPATSEWKSGSFTFTPEKDGKLDIALCGQWSKELPDRSWILFDNVKAEGVEIKNGDFENGASPWAFNMDKEGGKGSILDGGKESMGCVKVNHDHRATQKVDVKAGQPVKISFDYKLAE